MSLKDTVELISQEKICQKNLFIKKLLKLKTNYNFSIKYIKLFWKIKEFYYEKIYNNYLFTFFLQSCAPLVGTIGMVSLGAHSKQKDIGTTINDNIIKTKISNLIFKLIKI
jgi:hypothetical protein